MDERRISVTLESALGPPIIGRRPTSDELQSRRSVLPERLIDLWQDHGFAGYADGLFWTTDPVEYEPFILPWERIPRTSHVIGRDAFANMYILEGAEVYRFSPHTDDHDLLGSFEVFHEACVIWSEGQRMHMWSAVFLPALARHGVLAVDECFGFFPALGLGGEVAPEFVQRVKIREHLTFLGQLNGG